MRLAAQGAEDDDVSARHEFGTRVHVADDDDVAELAQHLATAQPFHDDTVWPSRPAQSTAAAAASATGRVRRRTAPGGEVRTRAGEVRDERTSIFGERITFRECFFLLPRTTTALKIFDVNRRSRAEITHSACLGERGDGCITHDSAQLDLRVAQQRPNALELFEGWSRCSKDKMRRTSPIKIGLGLERLREFSDGVVELFGPDRYLKPLRRTAEQCHAACRCHMPRRPPCRVSKPSLWQMDKGSTRRVAAGLLAFIFGTVAVPVTPASATSTKTEITQARKTDREIVMQQGVVTDPLLNTWVRQVSKNLWQYVGRKDVPYSIKILDESDVNAFTIGGGFIYVNEGTLDFVQSDDELAGVIGHETGHNEHRHPITLRQRSEILEILFSLAAILAPMSLGVGSFAEQGLIAKTERNDEFQADQYGLKIMTQAGYDPDAMLTFMRRLGEQHEGEEVDKYFADHPGVPDRLKRLSHYPELDPRTRSVDLLERQAAHDEVTARYAIAARQFGRVLATRPDDAAALLGLGHMQVALGLPARAAQSFEHAAVSGTPAQRAQAKVALAHLRGMPPGVAPDDASRKQLAAVGAARDAMDRISETVTPQRNEGLAKLSSLQTRLQALSNDAVDLNPDGAGDDGSATVHTLETLGRSVNGVLERTSSVLQGSGSLSPGREGGLLDDDVEIMREISELVETRDLPASDTPLLTDAPAMLASLNAAGNDAASGVSQSREALHLLDGGLDRLDLLLRAVVHAQLEANGHIDTDPHLLALANDAQQSLAAALIAAQSAEQAYNKARARGLATRITLLDLTAPVSRISSLRACALTALRRERAKCGDGCARQPRRRFARCNRHHRRRLRPQRGVRRRRRRPSR